MAPSSETLDPERKPSHVQAPHYDFNTLTNLDAGKPSISPVQMSPLDWSTIQSSTPQQYANEAFYDPNRQFPAQHAYPQQHPPQTQWVIERPSEKPLPSTYQQGAGQAQMEVRVPERHGQEFVQTHQQGIRKYHVEMRVPESHGQDFVQTHQQGIRTSQVEMQIPEIHRQESAQTYQQNVRTSQAEMRVPEVHGQDLLQSYQQDNRQAQTTTEIAPETNRHNSTRIMPARTESQVSVYQPDLMDDDDDPFDISDDEDMLMEDHAPVKLFSVDPQDEHLRKNDLGIVVALQASQDNQGLRMRSLYDFIDREDMLATYAPSLQSSPLRDPMAARLFCHFVNVTAPIISMFERHPANPSLIFQGQPIPKSQQHIWTCKLSIQPLYLLQHFAYTSMTFRCLPNTRSSEFCPASRYACPSKFARITASKGPTHQVPKTLPHQSQESSKMFDSTQSASKTSDSRRCHASIIL